MASASRNQDPQLFGVIGYPLRVTHSPAIFNAAFAALNLPHAYAPFRMVPAELKNGLAAAATLGARGLNVTYPHKESVARYARTMSPLARSLGAINTLTRRPAGWHGENTDVAGFLGPLARWRRSLRGKPALVFGAGGAARAVVYSLVVECDVSAVLVVGRPHERSRSFVKWASSLNRSVPVSLGHFSRIEDWKPALKKAGLIVNATPVGMSARTGRLLPLRTTFSRSQIVYDLVYGTETDLLKRAQRGGARVVRGEAMLLAQAAKSFELWTGRVFPEREVRKALKGSL
jgi:shikimate dehydrogenase